MVPQTQRAEDQSQDNSVKKSIVGIEVIPLSGLPIIEQSINLSKIILDGLQRECTALKKGDIIVIAHTVVSIAERMVVQSKDVMITEEAERIAQSTEQKPQKVQVALNEASEVLTSDKVLITRTRHGIITDMSGVDESNAPPGCYVTLPRNPDASADQISEILSGELGFRIPVIIADTQGRPWRRGAVNLAIGVAAMSPFTENAGKRDLYGRQLQSSQVCLADELAAAAELVMGQANEGIPVAIIRGISLKDENGSATQIIRDKDKDLFR
jgi:coenzyme F420-0:L-glutamate ligase/coenzyme F420-1:gamma-L-glutamate ligase